MSYAILRMQKIKSVGVKGMQFHNQRERESQTNPDIDYEKSKLNYDLHNEHSINFNKKVDEIIKENVKTDKKIRKDAVRLCDIVVTSDPKFFNKLTDIEIRKFFKESYEFLCNRYGNENIVYSTVHLDETTPHMHFGLVPVTKDNKLSAKEIFNRQELRDLQSDYHKFINEKGFDLERGIPSDKKGLKTQEFKKQTLKQEIENKIKEKNILQNDLKAIREDLNKYKHINIDFNDINRLEGKGGFLSKDKIVLDKHDFDYLKDIAKKQLILEKEFKSLKKENRDLKTNAKDFDDYFKESQIKGWALQKENLKLKKEISEQQEKLEAFQNFIKENNQTENLKVFLEERNRKIIEMEEEESWEMEL